MNLTVIYDLKMFKNKPFGTMLVSLCLIAGLTTLTKASIISKDLYDEELGDYDENFESNSEQHADCSCKNGVCVKTGDKYACTCPTGWGKYSLKLPECRECNCGKGINCTFDPGFFKDDKYCLCPDGKTLKNEPCKETTQEFKGVGIQKTYKTGDELKKDADADCKCVNGTCVNDGKRDICTCRTGWGKFSSYECRECNCGKGINCTFDVGFWKDDTYCICPDGKTLKNEPCKDNCFKDPCKNGGTCQNEMRGYTCKCPNGYLGKNCENIDNCFKDPCKNGGTCQNEMRGYTCKCPNGYFGKHCENCVIFLDFCASNPCKNGGTCLNHANGYDCSCPVGFSGTKCEIKASCEYIGNYMCSKVLRKCVNNPELGYKCGNCLNDSYIEEYDTCIQVTCKNIGYEYCGEMNRVCSENTTEGYECGDCKEGYVEDTETKKCFIATCANKGNEECGNLNRTCYNDSEISYKCGGCLDGFLPVEKSESCTEDLCMSSPCNNFGICKVVNNRFVCFCHHPFYGETCEQEIVPTTLLPSTIANYTLPEDITNSTVDDEHSTESSNFTSDFNQTTSKIETTKTTVGYTTSVDFNATTSYPTTYVDTTTTPKITTKSDIKLKFILKNVYSVRNLTELIIKT